MTRQQTPPECPVCGLDMIYIDHWEDDGDLGSHEPYWECPDDCPLEVDTMTEFGIVPIIPISMESTIL